MAEQHEERRADDGRMQNVMDLMKSQHETTRQLITHNREHFDQKVDWLASQFKEEIPNGHGAYHKKLIEDAARRQARIDAAAQGGIKWLAGVALGVLAVWASGAWHTFAKSIGLER